MRLGEGDIFYMLFCTLEWGWGACIFIECSVTDLIPPTSINRLFPKENKVPTIYRMV